jgi:hypothetical protein
MTFLASTINQVSERLRERQGATLAVLHDQLALAVLPTALQHLLAEQPTGAFTVDTLAQRAHDLASAMVAWRPE